MLPFHMLFSFSDLGTQPIGTSRAPLAAVNTLLTISAEPSGLMLLGAVIFVGGLVLRRVIISLSRRLSSSASATQQKEAW